MFNRPADAAYDFGKALVDGVLAQRFGPRQPRLPAVDLAPIELPADRLEQLVGKWSGRAFMQELKINNGTLGMQVGGSFKPVKFLSPSVAFTVGADGSAVVYDYAVAREAEPAHLECFVGEISLDYNDGPHDVAGPDKPSWAPFEAEYRIYQWGKPSETAKVHRRNGWLYVNDIRLVVETEPGLFFTSDGEAVDFRSNPPTWRNILLQRAT
jgi:hypothetical protein